ncbi:hypothetical protein [Pseudoduganella rhizocola]|uniref:hypothetical protein n=1 Tax=Pseudoduganella rhizocola TaxID=3382643 RepID=UPI0038B63F03
MTRNAKRICSWWGAVLMLLLCLYAAMGILQAGSIFTGERAAQNLRFWGLISTVSLLFSIVFGLIAIRLGRSAEQDLH